MRPDSTDSSGGGGPKANAKKFLEGLYHMDYAAAKEVATEKTKEQLVQHEQMMSMMQQGGKEEAKKIKVDIKDPKVEGDNATVEYSTSNDPSVKTLRMVKVDGKWLAEWSKMESAPSGAMPGPDDMNSGMDNTAPAPDTFMAPPADGAAMPTDTAATR